MGLGALSITKMAIGLDMVYLHVRKMGERSICTICSKGIPSGQSVKNLRNLQSAINLRNLRNQ